MGNRAEDFPFFENRWRAAAQPLRRYLRLACIKRAGALASTRFLDLGCFGLVQPADREYVLSKAIDRRLEKNL